MRTSRKLKSRRRGATLVLVTVLLFVLMGFAALAVDVGHLCAVTTEQQNTADGAALAGSSALQDSLLEDAVLERALHVIALNQEPQGYRSLDTQIIQIGKWSSTTGEFTEMDLAEVEDAFAVRVVAMRPEMPYFFAPIFGKFSTDVTREAVAVASGHCGGIWGLTGITSGGGIITDSYNSLEGPYDAATAYDNGDLCSGMAIKVAGNFEINGDVMSGFGYDVTVAGNAGDITGITTNNSGGLDGPSVELGDAEFNNDNDTIGLTDGGVSPWKKDSLDLGLTGQDNLTLNPGTYVFDDLKLSGGSTLTVTGPTTIYVTDSLAAGGGSISNITGDPHNLTIKVLGEDAKLGGGTAFYGSIIAPYAEVVLGGTADYYGAVIGLTVNMGGDIIFHVDESLVEVDWKAPPIPMLVR